jgi:ketosteroid isomerase-like protein
VINDPIGVVDAFHAAVLASDAETAMAYLHQDVRVTMHFRDYALPYVGHSVGWDAARTRLVQVIQEWKYLEMRQTLTLDGPDVVRQMCPTVMQHRRSGAVLEASFRNIFRMKDGKIIALDGYADVELLKSFLRMIGLPHRRRAGD